LRDLRTIADRSPLVFLKSMDDFGRMNAAYEKLMPMPKPARSCIQVAKNPNDVRIEIECIARCP
jgi:enamine deaminase RidA (YjgF/YER057c/UK114 family)